MCLSRALDDGGEILFSSPGAVAQTVVRAELQDQDPHRPWSSAQSDALQAGPPTYRPDTPALTTSHL